MKKFLVTGGAGFIGSHIVDKLVSMGHSVIVVDDLSTGDEKNFKKNKESKGQYEFVELDISSLNASETLIELTKGIDYVFHLAAIPRTQYCVENPIECHEANVTGTLNVLNACVVNNVKKIIHSSSCGIYGIQERLPIAENASINHGTPYSLQKYMQELYIKLYHDLFGLKSIMLRYFNVYGTQRQTEKGSYPNVLAAFSKQKREDGKIYVTGDGEQSRDMIHVHDVVNANIMAMESDIDNAIALNVGTGFALSINEMAEYFDCPIKHIPDRPGEAKHLYCDTTKVERLLNWKAKISFKEGMKIYFES